VLDYLYFHPSGSIKNCVTIRLLLFNTLSCGCLAKKTGVDIDGFMHYAVYGFLANTGQKKQKATATLNDFTL
jgi:translation initiation factor 1 (eIF-1/SUI1)